MFDPWLLLRTIKIANLSVVYRDEIAHYIILVLTFQIIHPLSILPFSSLHVEDAFVGEIVRKFDVLTKIAILQYSWLLAFSNISIFTEIEIFTENKKERLCIVCVCTCMLKRH